MPETRRLVLEPIRVVMPPRIEAKLSTIIDRLGGAPPLLAKVWRIGMKMTTTGVLLRMPLMSSTASRDATSAVSDRPPAMRSSARAPWSSAPVCASPWPITISPSNAISAGLAKPASKASGPRRLPPSGPVSGKA